LHVDDDVETLEADELRVKQVLLNLLSNAVKFTSDGGTITVAAAHVPTGLSISVTDTGVGIAPEDRERIFESFQQGPRGVATQEGTGLGLTLCRRIVELMGGHLWLESEVGVGSTFGFVVPDASARRSDGPAPPQVARRSRVLVIEDDSQSVDLLRVYLEATGFEVATALDGISGLQAARNELPAAIVLDIRIPRLDGWGVLAALKADVTTRHIPVFVVSVVDERHRGRALGAADYLVKPVSREGLLTALARFGLAAASQHEAPLSTGRTV
jgi:CheY-like chemotaxis protein